MMSPTQSQRLESIVSTTADTVRAPDSFFEGALDGVAHGGHGHHLSPRSLARGHVGAALLHAALARRDDAHRRSAFNHLGVALRAPGRDLSLYGGWAGLYAVLIYASESGRYYRDAVAGVGEQLRAAAAASYRARRVTASADFDVVSGAAGIALALRGDAPPEILSLLTGLAMDPVAWKVPMPGANQLGPVHNLGMAHGIAGVLAALCWSTAASGSHEAKSAIVQHLTQSAIIADGAPAWNSATGTQSRLPPLWHWCYGTAGVASVLALAAEQLGDDECTHLAEAAMAGIAARIVRSSCVRLALALPDFGICHGLAGLALLLDRFEKRHSSVLLAAAAARCTTELIAAHDTNARYGYQAANDPGDAVDDNGFLTGSVGIALVLATLAGGIDDRWVAVLGIAPADGVPPPTPCLRLT